MLYDIEITGDTIVATLSATSAPLHIPAGDFAGWLYQLGQADNWSADHAGVHVLPRGADYWDTVRDWVRRAGQKAEELLLLYLVEVQKSFEATVVLAKAQAEPEEADPVLVTVIEII